jgi:hypothetical protein
MMKLNRAFKEYFDLINDLPYDKVVFYISESKEDKKCMIEIHCKRVVSILYNQISYNYSSKIGDILNDMDYMFPYTFYFRKYVFTDPHPSMIPEEYFGKKETLIV